MHSKSFTLPFSAILRSIPLSIESNRLASTVASQRELQLSRSRDVAAVKQLKKPSLSSSGYKCMWREMGFVIDFCRCKMRGWPRSVRRTKRESSVPSVAKLKGLQFWHFTSSDVWWKAAAELFLWNNPLQLQCGELADDNKWLHHFTRFTIRTDSEVGAFPCLPASSSLQLRVCFISPPIRIHSKSLCIDI